MFLFEGFLANRFGGKFLFGGGVFITAVLTILTPFCAQQNIALLVTVRVLEGLCEVTMHVTVVVYTQIKSISIRERMGFKPRSS